MAREFISTEMVVISMRLKRERASRSSISAPMRCALSDITPARRCDSELSDCAWSSSRMLANPLIARKGARRSWIRVGERLEFPVGFFQLRGAVVYALFQPLVQAANFFFG